MQMKSGPLGMSGNVTATSRMTQVAYFLLRVVAGAMFIQTGGNILFHWFAARPEHQAPPFVLMSQTGIGGVLQFFGGILIVLGLGTRVVAFLCSGMMAVAFWQFHFKPSNPWPAEEFNGGMPAVLLCFIFLYVTMQGGGKWSLDAVIRRRMKKP